MSKMVRRWVRKIIEENGPQTCHSIIQKLKKKRNCPSTHQLANYLAKFPEFTPVDIQQTNRSNPVALDYWSTGAVSVWGLVDGEN